MKIFKQLNRPVEVGKSLRIFFQLVETFCAVEVNIFVIWVEFEGFIIIGNRGFGLTQKGALTIIFHIIGRKFNSSRHVFASLVVGLVCQIMSVEPRKRLAALKPTFGVIGLY